MTDKHQQPRTIGKFGATCRRTDGQPCGGRPAPGTVPPVCKRHLPNPKARAKAAVRAELAAWRITDETVEPGQVLLRLLAQSARRAALYGLLLEQAYATAVKDAGTAEDERVVAALAGTTPTPDIRVPRGTPAGVAALVGNTIGYDKDVGFYAKAEELRGLVRLEADERERCARWAKMALDAGIAERLVRLAEDQAEQVVQLLRRVVIGLGLSPTDPRVSEVVTAELRALDAGTAA